MRRRHTGIFHSHLALASHYWQALVKQGDCVVDATCGNGYDTLALRRLVGAEGQVFAFDIQDKALNETYRRLMQELGSSAMENVKIIKACHSTFSRHLLPASAKLVVYNLGYLPGGNKLVTTTGETTLQSLQEACSLLQEEGVLSVMCYSGHPAGAREEEAILTWAQKLPPQEWACCHHRWLNRKHAPSLLLLSKLPRP